MPSCTNLSLCLITSSKNYISYPKGLIKTAATILFGRKVSQGSSFKNDSQFNSNFSIAVWCCGCAASETFLSHLLTLSYWICWHYDIKLPFYSKIKLNSSFSLREKILNFNLSFLGGICKSRLYSLDVSKDSTDFRFFFSLYILNDDYISWKFKNFYQVRQVHVKKLRTEVV